MYPFNYPFATFFGSLGMSLYIKIEALHDLEANVYYASSPNVKGLHVEAESFDDLIKEVEKTLPDLLEINENCKSRTAISHKAKLNYSTPLHA